VLAVALTLLGGRIPTFHRLLAPPLEEPPQNTRLNDLHARHGQAHLRRGSVHVGISIPPEMRHLPEAPASCRNRAAMSSYSRFLDGHSTSPPQAAKQVADPLKIRRTVTAGPDLSFGGYRRTCHVDSETTDDRLSDASLQYSHKAEDHLWNAQACGPAPL
jgi:hypothetical protein